MTTKISRRIDLTFRHNKNNGRHGWLRLTPAYSIKIVEGLLEKHNSEGLVLDPFSGTGTTGVVCGEFGVNCDLTEINPFLVWLARVKAANYSSETLTRARAGVGNVLRDAHDAASSADRWIPPIANLDRWWNPPQAQLLGRLSHSIMLNLREDVHAYNLALVAFCRCVIEWSNAAFNHQSMSFKAPELTLFDEIDEAELLGRYRSYFLGILDDASVPLKGNVGVREMDARMITPGERGPYKLIITSPPYPNRMSYVRELRPYMYWLKYLSDAREAGELDWKAIGGTWGIATSRTEKWDGSAYSVAHDGFGDTIEAIRSESHVLANYVHKYFVDMTSHLESVYASTAPGASIHYIVGNSKFYDTMVDVEQIFSSLMQNVGFENIRIETIRKRNSKKELFEYIVSAVKGD